MVKDNKNKNRYVEVSENCSGKDCKSCLKSNGVVLSVNDHVPRSRCILLHMLVDTNIEHLMTLKMNELKDICVSTSVETSSRDRMVNEISNTMLDVVEDAEENTLLLALDA